VIKTDQMKEKKRQILFNLRIPSRQQKKMLKISQMKSKRVGGPVIPHSPMMIRKNKKKRTHLESEVGKGFERRQMFREMQCTNTVRRGRTKTKRKERGTRGKRNVPRKKSYTEWPFPESADMTRYRAACLLVLVGSHCGVG